MEAPNLERTSSLTWSGIGGLNWDRTSVLPNVQDQPRARTASASVAITSSSRLSASYQREDASHPIAAVDALLADDDEDVLPAPTMLKRAVTFSGDFPHDGSGVEPDPLVAAPPGLLGMGAPSQATNGVYRQRATSDAVAFKAAWGPVETTGSLSPDAVPFPYSPASNHRMLPRRSHSMSLEPTVWGPGGPESPRERSRTTHTLSVGSPDTEVQELLDMEEYSFGVRDPSIAGNGSTRLQQYGSPMQHGMYSSNSSGAPNGPPMQSRLSLLGQGSAGHPGTSTTPQPIAPFGGASAHGAPATLGVPSAHSRLPTPPYSGPFPTHSGANPSLNQSGSPPLQMSGGAFQGVGMPENHMQQPDANLLEIQIQNLQAMQQQWLQMMQMQFDQTLYQTQQRLQNMNMAGAPNNNGLPFVPPKIGKYPANHGYDNAGLSPQQGMYPSSGATPAGNNSRSSPPTHRQHRRQENGSSAPGQFSASNLLAEHKVTGRRLTAQELAGHVVEFSKDSHGSRLVQYKMETGTAEERRAFVNEALPHTLSLAMDLFGNYVVQNFFDNAAQDQRDMLASALKGNVMSLCTHPHGCRVVQRALFVISASLRNDIIDELLELPGNSTKTENIIRSCARNAHATHVLQKAVSSLQRAVGLKSSFKEPNIPEDAEDPPGERARASRALESFEIHVLAECIPLSMHQQACRLVQRVLGACDLTKSSPRVGQLLAEVFKNIDSLAVHQNGNFVLQHIVEAAEPSLAAQVQAYVCTNVVRLARHKFGSHLVEKCLSCATQPQINSIVEKFLSPLSQELMGDLRDDFEVSVAEDSALGLVPSTLPVLMKDPYANFVVQKAFDVSRGETRGKLSQEIRARTASLSKFSYGRHILTHINKAGGAQSSELQ